MPPPDAHRRLATESTDQPLAFVAVLNAETFHDGHTPHVLQAVEEVVITSDEPYQHEPHDAASFQPAWSPGLTPFEQLAALRGAFI